MKWESGFRVYASGDDTPRATAVGWTLRTIAARFRQILKTIEMFTHIWDHVCMADSHDKTNYLHDVSPVQQGVSSGLISLGAEVCHFRSMVWVRT